MRIGGRSSGPVPVSETRPKGMIRFAGAQKPPPPLAAQLQRMGSLKSLAERQNLYQTLRAQHPLPYRAAEKAALEQTLLQIRGLAQQAAQTPGGLSRLMQQLHKRGYLLLFKDDVLRPGKDTRALLEAFEYDTQDIREYERAYRRDGEALTVGELLPEFFNADACFVPGDQAENARSSPQRGTFKSPRQGYLLFSDSFDQLRPNLLA